MRIIYLNNSGFALELDYELLVIDYYIDKSKSDVITPQYLAAFEHILVLSSHSHADHFNPAILKWQEYAKVDYVFSSDIKEKIHEQSKNMQFISEGQQLQIKGFSITAYGSTDIGVSFHIQKEKLSLFHAGDLNFWHWRQESTEQEVADSRLAYDRILENIAGKVGYIDVAFFPVDPRMGEDYYRGAVLFAQKLAPKIFIPMHFGKEYAPPQNFLDEIRLFTIPKDIKRSGEIIEYHG